MKSHHQFLIGTAIATADNMEIGMTQSFVDSFVSSFGI
jgi:hypothetical protein